MIASEVSIEKLTTNSIKLIFIYFIFLCLGDNLVSNIETQHLFHHKLLENIISINIREGLKIIIYSFCSWWPKNNFMCRYPKQRLHIAAHILHSVSDPKVISITFIFIFNLFPKWYSKCCDKMISFIDSSKFNYFFAQLCKENLISYIKSTQSIKVMCLWVDKTQG